MSQLTILIVPFSAPIILSIAFSNAVITETMSKKKYFDYIISYLWREEKALSG